MSNRCVIDASMGFRDGMFCYCPIEGDIHSEFSVITGLNYASFLPPDGMTCVGIWHPDGDEAVEAFCEEYADDLQILYNALQEEEHSPYGVGLL